MRLLTASLLCLLCAACVPASAAWFDNDWGYRISVTIESDEVDSTLTNFPVYVNLDDMPDSFFTNVDSAGADIRVTRSDEVTECARQVVDIDTSAKTGELHFNANSISSSTDTTFYIYYGNGAASEPAADATYGSENTWNANYVLVMHLGEGDSTASDYYKDSTSNDNHGTLTDSDADSVEVTGQLGQAFHLNGDADYIKIADSVELDGHTDMTFSMWVDLNSGSGLQAFLNKRGAYNSNHSYSMGMSYGAASPCTAELEFESSTTGSNYPYNCSDKDATTWTVWNFLTWTYDSGAAQNVVPYINGVAQTLLRQEDGDAALYGSSVDLYLGIVNSNSPVGFLPGSLDEVRIMDDSMSAAWIDAEYTNQSATTTFYTVGSEEEPPAASERRVIVVSKFLFPLGRPYGR